MKYKKIAVVIIGFIALISVFAGFIAQKISFNYSIESYFPKGEPEVEFYNTFSQQFGRDIGFVLIGIENKNGIFNPSFLNKIDQFSKGCRSVKDVIKVTSPTTLKNLIKTPSGFTEIDILHINDAKRLQKDSISIFKNKEWVGSYFSKKGNAVNIIITTKPLLDKQKGDSLLQALDEMLATYQFDTVKIAGRIRTQNYYITQMGNEFIMFSLLSIVLLVIFLLLIYRSFWPIWVSALVIGLSIMWTIAIIILIDGQMSMLLTMLPILLFVIGISDVIHIITKYVEELRNGADKIAAITTTVKEVGLATFLTSLTTSLGFLSLISSNSPPIREFGLYVAIGVMITYFISILLLPALLILSKAPKIGTNFHQTPSFWNIQLRKGLYWMVGNKIKIVVATIVITLVASLGIFNVKINNLFLDDLSEKSELKQDLNFFEDHFDGIRPLEIAIYSTDSNKTILEYETMQDILKIENYIQQNFEVGAIFSPLEIVRKTNRAFHTGNINYYKLPSSKSEHDALIQKIKKIKILNKAVNTINSEFTQCRMSTKLKDIGSAELREKNKAFYQFIASEIKSPIEVKITGMPHLLDTTNAYITSRLVRGLSLAIVVIALIIGIMYRSITIVLISLVPNIIPLIIVGGIMGYFNMDLKISTGIVFTIAFGIAVDDTIHFLSKFKIELAKGKSVPLAIKRTFLSTGKAIVLTSIILSSGFISFTFSDFESTVMIGILICITLITAVIADLFLLPLLILKFYKKPRS